MTAEERAKEILDDAACFCVEHKTDEACPICVARSIRDAEDEALERAAREVEKPLGSCLNRWEKECSKCEAIRFAATCIRSLKSKAVTP